MTSREKVASAERLLLELKRLRAASVHKRIWMWIPHVWGWSFACFKSRVLVFLKPKNIFKTLKYLLYELGILGGTILLILSFPLCLLFFLPVSFCLNWFEHTKLTNEQLDKSIEGWAAALEDYKLHLEIAEKINRYEHRNDGGKE